LSHPGENRREYDIVMEFPDGRKVDMKINTGTTLRELRTAAAFGCGCAIHEAQLVMEGVRLGTFCPLHLPEGNVTAVASGVGSKSKSVAAVARRKSDGTCARCRAETN